MALKYAITAADHGGLDEATQKLYVEKDGGFVLDVDGVVPAEKLDEFRTNNRTLNGKVSDLMTQLGAFEGVDPKEFARLKTLEEELSKKGIKKPDDVSKQIKDAIEASLQPLTTKLTTLETQLQEKDRTVAEQTRRERLRDVAAAHGVDDAMFDEFAANMRQFVVEEGKLAARDANGAVIIGDDGHALTAEAHVRTLRKAKPGLFRPDAGSGAPTNQRRQVGRTISADQIGANLADVAAGKVAVSSE